MQEYQVQIGPEFFKKSKNDYSDWRFAFVREMLQNAIDSNAKNIHINISNNNDLKIVCKDDGIGMDKSVIVDKLFSLGASGKDFNNSVGGFGKAKELLYFCQQSYQIHSRNNFVSGIGGSYNIKDVEYYQGTISTIVLDDYDYLKNFYENLFEQFITSSTYSGNFYLNDRLISERVVTNEVVKMFSFGKVYRTDLFKNKIVVRINGLPMFSNVTTADYGLVLELSGKSSDHLSSSRDCFNWSCYTEFQNFLNILAQCSKEFVRRLEPQIIKYFGKESYQTSMIKDMEAYIEQIEDQIIKDEIKGIVWEAENNVRNLDPDQLEKFVDKIKTSDIVKRLSDDIIKIRNYIESDFQTDYDFEIENHFDNNVDEKYLPETFNEYSETLVHNWRICIKQILKILNIEQNFYVGFIFCNKTLATHRKSSNGVHRYMLNPFGKSDKEYYNKLNFHELILTACHEIVHSFGNIYHNESFLCSFEEILEKIVPEMNNIRNLFKIS